MTRYRVTTFYTAYIITEVVAESEAAACEQVREDPTEYSAEYLREELEEIEESWTQHREAREVPSDWPPYR